MDIEYNVLVGKRLFDSRKNTGMTRAELGKIINLHESTVKRYEDGQIKNLSIDKIKEFAKALNVSSEFLMGWDETKDINFNIPNEYAKNFKFTAKDKIQYASEMKKANEAFFLDDDLSEDAKKEMLDLMSELFWEAKRLNKRTPKDK